MEIVLLATLSIIPWVSPDLYLRQTGLPSSSQVVVSYPELDVLSSEHFGHQAGLAVFIVETVRGWDDVSAGNEGSAAKTSRTSSLYFSNTNEPGVLVDLII